MLHDNGLAQESDFILPPLDQSLYFEDGRPTPLSKSQRRQANRAKNRAQKAAAQEAKKLVPRTENQAIYMEFLSDPEIFQIFAVGEAGTGKTYIPARVAARKLKDKEVQKILIGRPTVSVGENHRQGFLPGDLKKKLSPWLVAITSALIEELGSRAEFDKRVQLGEIEFLSFEHMRGRTFDNSFVILDESQNCTLHDLKLFLTRIGENTTYVIAGDPTQVDISNSGLEIVLDMVEEYDLSPAIVEFDENDVVRSAAAKEWVQAFSKRRKENEPST